MKKYLLIVLAMGVLLYATFHLYLRSPAFKAWEHVSEYTYEHDMEQFGKIERWQTPEEFHSNKKGDCEDFAIAMADHIGLQCIIVGEFANSTGNMGHAWIEVDGYIIDNGGMHDINDPNYIYHAEVCDYMQIARHHSRTMQ